jgi:hypothetical protein
VARSQTPGRKSREAIYRQLDEGVEELRTRLGGLPTPVEAEDIWGDIWYQEVHNSTAIEGNTLVLREVELLLREGRAVGDKQLAEYLEVRGWRSARDSHFKVVLSGRHGRRFFLVAVKTAEGPEQRGISRPDFRADGGIYLAISSESLT